MNTKELTLGGWVNALLIGTPTMMVANTINQTGLILASLALTIFAIIVRIMFDSTSKEPFNSNKVFSFAVGAAISAVVLVGSYFLGGLTI